MHDILTPHGYTHASTLSVEDEVCAFDAETGERIINTIEGIQPVDYAEWCRWWQCEDKVPPFSWYRINGSFLLFREQSIWRNGTNVCHARNLVVGDKIYDDADQPVAITSIEVVEDNSLVWYRFDVSGDHSYIVDGLTVHNASRFLITGGGSVSWTAVNTAIWSASSGGSTGASVPGSADTVTFDGSSGGGTVTVNFGGTITLQSIAMGAFTGTFDNSVNNNNMTLTGNAGFNASGTGARTVKLGTATYSITSSAGIWTTLNASNLTLTAGSSTIVFSGGSGGGPSFSGGGQTYGTVTLGSTSGTSSGYTFNGASTIGTLNLTGPIYITWPGGSTNTITNAFNWAGSPTAPIGINFSGVAATLAVAAGSTMSWASIRGITFTGSPTATNSLDFGSNSGITISPPSAGGAHFSATIV